MEASSRGCQRQRQVEPTSSNSVPILPPAEFYVAKIEAKVSETGRQCPLPGLVVNLKAGKLGVG